MRYSASRLTKLAINAAAMTMSLLATIADCGSTQASPSPSPTTSCVPATCHLIRLEFSCYGGSDCHTILTRRDCGQCPEDRWVDYKVLLADGGKTVQTGRLHFPAGAKTADLQIDTTGLRSNVWVELSDDGIVYERAEVTITGQGLN